jgi:hypothetical protein
VIHPTPEFIARENHASMEVDTSPMSVQTKVEPEAVLAAKTTTKIPKAINPAEIRNESTASIVLIPRVRPTRFSSRGKYC